MSTRLNASPGVGLCIDRRIACKSWSNAGQQQIACAGAAGAWELSISSRYGTAAAKLLQCMLCMCVAAATSAGSTHCCSIVNMNTICVLLLASPLVCRRFLPLRRDIAASSSGMCSRRIDADRNACSFDQRIVMGSHNVCMRHSPVALCGLHYDHRIMNACRAHLQNSV